jgi:hypothetical protein
MLGWWIIVSAQIPDERDKTENQAAILAQWKAGVGGIDWLERLVDEGKAEKLSQNGYPNRYTARADDVLPLIEGGGIKPSTEGIWIFGIDDDEDTPILLVG